MTSGALRVSDLERRLADAEATIEALLSGQIDAVVDAKSHTPVLLSKAQDALRESEERYRRIVEATTDGIFQLDGGAVISFVNRRFAEMLGHDAREMIGRSIFDFMNADARELAARWMKPDAEILHTLDSTFRHQEGSDISVNIAGSRLRAGEADAGYLGMVRDVTERNRLQSQLMVSDRMASVGTLAAGVAHEINNPLAAVIANLDYLSESLVETGAAASGEDDTWLRAQLRSPLDDAREAAHRVRVIVSDLKVFSRSPELEARQSVDVEATMEASLRIAWNEIRHRAQLVKSYGVVPGVEANEARLGQVFLNLLVNAAQAIPEGRAEHNRIGITTQIEGDRVIIEVSDTGAGIPPAIIGRVFDAFFTTKPVGVGTGLGLAICHRIITDMGGELTVRSQLGEGTTFRVSLAASTWRESGAPVKVEPVPVSSRRAKILVVDDESLVARSIQRVLAREHDVVVETAAVEALALCSGGERFDLILCDLMMPDMNGMDFHLALCALDPDQAARMVFMTGGAFTPDAMRFLEPPREHIEKPFAAATLRLIVQRHTRGVARPETNEGPPEP